MPGVEISAAAPSGHGLPLGVGTALGLRARRTARRVVVMMGDGEFDEGSNHEAMAIAGRLGLDRLTAIVIDNASASTRCPAGSPAASRWRAGARPRWTGATTTS